jgi:CBS domain-containing protein
MLVSDIMTLDPNCCTPECTAQEAAVQMRQWATGVLLVVADMEGRRLAGIVTDRDLCLGVVAAGRVPAHVTVGECMTCDAVCCAVGEPVGRVLEVMRKHRVRRLPVVDSSGRVLGVVSLTDMVRYAALPEADLVAAVAHIAEPRGGRERKNEKVAAPVSH